MSPILVFFCFLLGMVVVGKLVSLITGSKAYYLETTPLAEGERVLWEDMAADAYPIPTRRALIVTYRRSRRYAVRVTNLRIMAGPKGLFGTKHLIQHMLYPADRTYPAEASTVGGGLLTVGYQALVFQRSTAGKHSAEAKPFVDLTLDPTLPSSLNLERFRIYTDRLETFCLPD